MKLIAPIRRSLTLVIISGCLLGVSTQGLGSENITDTTQKEQALMVTISTEFGDMTLMLYNETPEHRDNFIRLVREGFYNGTLFHRVISGFMIQGGDPHSREAAPGQQVGSGGPGYTLPAEIQEGLFHKKGAIAAARQGDHVNPEKRSSGSQFYIVQGRVFSHAELDMLEEQSGITFSPEQRNAYTTSGGTPHLDQGYTVFGEVIEGFDVIDRIASVPTGQADRPLENVSMTITELK